MGQETRPRKALSGAACLVLLDRIALVRVIRRPRHTLGTYTRYAGKTIAKKATSLTGPLAAPVEADTDFSVTLI